jgi:DNA helicase-2/ATP-dependent DNA helicase PcrA
MVEIYAAYEAQCQQARAWSTSPSCCCARCELLRAATTALREHYQARFAHLLVDEFQDTNRAAVPAGCSCSPAGTAQACSRWATTTSRIYAFRGADVGNMRRLRARLPRANA